MFTVWHPEFNPDIKYRAWVVHPTGIEETHITLSYKTNCYYGSPQVKDFLFGECADGVVDSLASNRTFGGHFAILFDKHMVEKQLPFNVAACTLFRSLELPFKITRGKFMIVSYRANALKEEFPRDMPALAEVSLYQMRIILSGFVGRFCPENLRVTCLHGALQSFHLEINAALDKRARTA